MVTEITIQEFGFTAVITLYKGLWLANLSQNTLYALSGSALKNYISFIELVDFYVRELNSQKEYGK